MRRITLVLGVSLLVLSLCFGVLAKGVVSVYGPWSYGENRALKELFAEFEKQSGLQVKWEPALADFPSHVTKITTLLSSGDDTYDVIWLDDQITPNSVRAGWLEPFEGKYALPEGYLDDFPEGVVRDYAHYQGKVYRVPGQVEAMWMLYRKDIYEAAGLSVPTTWEEMVEIGQKLTHPEENKWGLIIAGQKGAFLSNELGLWMLQGGGDYIDWSLPGSKIGLQFMYDLVYKYKVAPESSWSTDYNIAPELFKQGVVATWFTWQGFWAVIKGDSNFAPDDTTLKSKVGVAKTLKGPGRDGTISGTWGWTINKFAKNKEGALQFILFMTSPEAQKKLALIDQRPVARLSVMAMPELWEQNPAVELLAKHGDIVFARSLMNIPRTNEVMEVQEEWAHRFLTGQVDIDTAIVEGDKAMKAIYLGQ